MSSISDNVNKVKNTIAEAANRSGRDTSEIQLVAVTKNVTADRISEAISCGIDIAGENRVQEARDKKPLVSKDISWHLIGHLQKNKTKLAVELFELIQSVDSCELAEELDSRARRIETIVDVLVEVNISGEESKYGLHPDGCKDFLKEISKFENLRVKGLMTMAPLVENLEDVRWVFKKARHLFDDLKNLKLSNVDFVHLSMGMSHDYRVAVEEGSTMVRVGSALFKE